MGTTVTLSASAKFGYGGKQFVARIVGRDPKFTFNRQFLGRKEGKRGEVTSVVVDEPGLYEERDIDRKGGATDTHYIVWVPPGGGLIKTSVEHEEAMNIARKIDEREPWDVIATDYLIADLEASIRSSLEKNQDEETDQRACAWGTFPAGKYVRRDIVAKRQALLATLRGPATPSPSRLELEQRLAAITESK